MQIAAKSGSKPSEEAARAAERIMREAGIEVEPASSSRPKSRPSPSFVVIVIVERLEVEEGDAEEEGEEGEVVEGQEGEEEEADEGKVIRGPPIVESTNIYFPIK